MITRRCLLKRSGRVLALAAFPSLALPRAGTQAWEFLKEGDVISVIAPSSPIDNPQERYAKIRAYFARTPFKVHIPDDLIEPTVPLDEANTIAKRARFVHEAFASDAKAIWAIGGGGWGASMLRALMRYPRPHKVKPILGYSDVTALHLYANAYLGIPSIHSVVLGINGDISPGWNHNGIDTALAVLSGATPVVRYRFRPLNATARHMTAASARIVGGNSLLVSALNGAPGLTLDSRNAFVFLESVADDPGRFSRKLMGLTYSALIRDCAGVIFGDVIAQGGKENPPAIQEQFDDIVQRFADQFAADKIVLKADNLFGHGPVNLPLPLNTAANFHRDGPIVTGSIWANRQA